MNKHQNVQLFMVGSGMIFIFFLYNFSYFSNFLQQIFIAFISKLTISIKSIIPLKCIKRRSMKQNIKSSIRSKYILELEYYKSGILNQRRKDTRFSKLHGNN